MAHHKRRRTRNQRACCKMCKPHKINGVNKEGPEGECHSDHVRRAAAREAIKEQELSYVE